MEFYCRVLDERMHNGDMVFANPDRFIRVKVVDCYAQAM
jgi:hypothetical protein